jgi:hypothetical protein
MVKSGQVTTVNGEKVPLKDGEITKVQSYQKVTGAKFQTGDDVKKFLEKYQGRSPASCSYACDSSHSAMGQSVITV